MQDYCAELVRKTDYPHYVITLFAPRNKRAKLFALYALNIELAKIRTLITEPMMGMIRLQWWRDSIEKLYAGEVLRHEVLQGLYNVIKCENPWRLQDLIALVDAYEADLQMTHFNDTQSIYDHAEAVGVQLMRLEAAVYGDVVAEPILKIIGGAEYLARRLPKDERFINVNKKSIMNDVLQKIKMVDKRILKNSPSYLSYNFIKWQLKSLIKDKQPNEGMLGFYLWRKSIGF